MVVLAAPGCTATGPVHHAAVDVREWAVEPAGSTLAAGPIELTVSNTGNETHTLVVETENGEIVTSGAILAPGDATTLEMSLEPGRYRFTCRLVEVEDDGTLEDHYQHGMVADVVVVPG